MSIHTSPHPLRIKFRLALDLYLAQRSTVCLKSLRSRASARHPPPCGQKDPWDPTGPLGTPATNLCAQRTKPKKLCQNPHEAREASGAPCNPALNIGKWAMGNGRGVSMNRWGSTSFGASDSNIKDGVAKGWGALPMTFRGAFEWLLQWLLCG